MCSHPDPTYWHDAILVIGTLGGAVLGGGFTYWQQSRQRAHDDKVRFHDARLDAYDKFDYAAGMLIAAAMVWNQRRPPGQSLGDFLGMVNEPYAMSYTRVRVVGSKSVYEAARALHAEVQKFNRESDPADVNATSQEALRLQREFLVAVRQELGTDREG